LSLSNIQYRDARLKIVVNGHGTEIRQFKLDGKVQKEPFFAAAAGGEHQIEITLK
jgi:hypothetical protein